MSEQILIYNLFPRLAGAMSTWKPHMERAKYMGFTWIYVNPLNYPGFSGSLYSIKDYYRINPLFLDDSQKSEEQQVRDMLSVAHELGLKVMFDYVINHTAVDSVLIEPHSDWYLKKPDGSIKHPQVWEGDKLVTTWGDLAEIDNENSSDKENLWLYWSELANYYIDLGVDGFRCDAAYQVPVDLWHFLISRTKEYAYVKPEKRLFRFFAETLGCEIEDVIALAQAGFDYNFNSSKYWDFVEPWCLKQYAENALVCRSVAFAESHDTPRLAKELNSNEAAIKMRYLFSVIFSTGVMMPLGMEYGFQDRVNVVKSMPVDWEEPTLNLVEFIRKANELKINYKLFREDSFIEPQKVGNEKIFAFLKISKDKTKKALVIINKDKRWHQPIAFNLPQILGCDLEQIRDISTEYALENVPEILDYNLRPSQVMIFYNN